jgi:hypothetical protein
MEIHINPKDENKFYKIAIDKGLQTLLRKPPILDPEIEEGTYKIR